MKRIITATLMLIFIIAAIAQPAAAQGGLLAPSFSILDVVPSQSVTIWTTALSANDTIQVFMGNYGTGGVGGAMIGTFNSGTGGQVTLTYNIPSSLKNTYQIDIRLQSTLSGLYSTNWFYNNTASPSNPYYPPTYPTPYPPYNPNYPPYPPYEPNYPLPYYPERVTPTISILNVVQDSSVTFTTNNFPTNHTFNVRMGAIGSMGINGTLAGSFYSAGSSSQIVTIAIPPNLRGSYQIAIRCESTTSGYYSFDWFYNTSNGQYNPPYSSFSFSIQNVVPNQSVTIQTTNFPAYQIFNVRMGNAGSQGIGGTLVDTVQSSSGGMMVLTFYIPANLRGYSQIDIRLESTNLGTTAYNTFNNQGIGPYPPGPYPTPYPPGPYPTPYPPGPYPTPYPPGPYTPSISVTNVLRDTSITIQASNFPPSTTYNVLMGYPGTYYQSGFATGTLNSGPGGAFSANFTIPYQLQGANQVLLWLVNTSTSELVSASFYNSTNNQGQAYYPYTPSFSITSVVRDSTVTILTNNFPPNDTYNVRMGAMGNMGINGTLVGSINSGAGSSFSATFNIPPNLYGSYQIAIRLESAATGYYAYNWFYNNSTDFNPTPIPGTPSVNVSQVVTNNSVTFNAFSFPANTAYNVLIGYPGTNYTSGVLAGSVNSASGSFSTTVNIPATFVGSGQLWLWLVNTATGQLTTSTSFTNSGGGVPVPPYGSIPSFSITSVVRDSTVTILTNNFPANDTYNVRMGAIGTQSIGGIIVGTVNSGAGGSFSATFNIPPSLYGSYQIAIRLESPSSGYYAYNWLYNNNAP